jgi:hypothetical protein
MGGAMNEEKEDKKGQKEEKTKKRIFICDRCGTEMVERNCKVVCKNCGNRFDCSDLNIYFD